MNPMNGLGNDRRKALLKRLEFRGIRRLSAHHYRRHVRNLYDGPAGAVLALSSFVSLHEPLVGHLLRSKRFDVSRFQHILDVGSGAGQLLGHLLKRVAPDTSLTGFDLSQRMLRRARTRLRSPRPKLIAGDLTHLPFASQSFDCITCGYVLEHLPDPLPGLKELGRVLKPGGSVLVLATEDTVSGTMTSHAWKCRTYNRRELESACLTAGLPWKEQLWFTAAHRFFKLGGILVEAQKPAAQRSNLIDWSSSTTIDAQGA
ncbi:MAG: class I SAM-dependent methyltransferase [Planctomycetaceae bacterium]